MITTTLNDGTVINMSYVTLVSPIIGQGQYASYEVYTMNTRESIGVFESDVPRATFLATLATVPN